MLSAFSNFGAGSGGQLRRRTRLWGNFANNPARVIVSSFALVIVIGTVLLMLPFSSRAGTFTPFMDALFTATSATCVTGLVVVDTYLHFSVVGQGVILLLIQCGGLGLVTFATFFNLALRRKVGLKSLYVAQESVNGGSMPETGHLVRMILATTGAFEGLGALLLMTVFVPEYGAQGIWISVFLAVSAYCNAGFDVLGFQGEYASLTQYSGNPVVLGTIMMLIVCGGLGFIVWQDIAHFRSRHRLTLHSKLVLTVTAVLVVSGAVVLGLCEWNNPATLGDMGVGEKLLNSLFMSVSARTAGFNAIPIESTHGTTKLLTSVLMFIGAAPGSTGGGIKVTTAWVLVMTAICVMRGEEDTIIQKRRVDKSVVYKALTITGAALLATVISAAVIFYSVHEQGMRFSEIDALFESVSAFGTVGLSCGVSTDANLISQIALILTMFVGRVGPVALALSLAMRPHSRNTVLPEAKIMVG